LREFGAPVWILTEGKNLSKLEPKSIQHVFVGFQEGPKAIKYFSAETRQIKISRDYRFHHPLNIKDAPDVPHEGEDKDNTHTSDVHQNGTSRVDQK